MEDLTTNKTALTNIPYFIRHILSILLVGLKKNPSVIAVALCGSWARGTGHSLSDLDAMAIIEDPLLYRIWGIHGFIEKIRVDLILIPHEEVHEKHNIYIEASILPNAKLLFSKCNRCTKWFKDHRTTIHLTTGEAENMIFHLKHIRDKIEAEKDQILRRIFISKFVYFVTLCFPRWYDYPIYGEAHGFQLIKKKAPKLYAYLVKLLDTQNYCTQNIFTLIIKEFEKLKPDIGSPLLEVRSLDTCSLITPIEYSPLSEKERIYAHSWWKKLLEDK